MARSRASAKKAGSEFERATADYLADKVDDRIDRQVKTGGKDSGDIAGLRVHGQKVAIECKNTARTDLAAWAAEAEQERQNIGGLAGVTIHKRHGNAKPGDQWVTMTLRDYVALITGTREGLDG